MSEWKRCIASIQRLIWDILMTMDVGLWIQFGLMFRGYRPSTIIATSIVMVVFIILLVLTMLEIRRMKKEDTLHIVLEDKTADEKI